MHILSQKGSRSKGLLEEKKYDKYKEKEKDNVTEDIYYEELFFGNDAST